MSIPKSADSRIANKRSKLSALLGKIYTMKVTEYTINYETKDNPFGDSIYQIHTKRQALKEANQLKKQGATSVWINLHVDDDIIGDIQIV